MSRRSQSARSAVIRAKQCRVLNNEQLNEHKPQRQQDLRQRKWNKQEIEALSREV